MKPLVGLRARPLGSATAGCHRGRVRGPRGSGPSFPPAQAQLAFHAHFCSPLTAPPRPRSSRGRALTSQEGDSLPTHPAPGCHPQKSSPAARLAGSGGASSRAPSGYCAATRDPAPPTEPPVRARLPTWETCGEMPRRGGFRSVTRPLSGAGGSSRRATPPRPGRHSLELQRRAAANGRRGGGPAGGCHPPGDGLAESGSARATASQAVGEGPREEEEEEPASSRPRTTARPGSGAPTLVPLPRRQHDRRAAPGLLLHRAEG